MSISISLSLSLYIYIYIEREAQLLGRPCTLLHHPPQGAARRGPNSEGKPTQHNIIQIALHTQHMQIKYIISRGMAWHGMAWLGMARHGMA